MWWRIRKPGLKINNSLCLPGIATALSGMIRSLGIAFYFLEKFNDHANEPCISQGRLGYAVVNVKISMV